MLPARHFCMSNGGFGKRGVSAVETHTRAWGVGRGSGVDGRRHRHFVPLQKKYEQTRETYFCSPRYAGKKNSLLFSVRKNIGKCRTRNWSIRAMRAVGPYRRAECGTPDRSNSFALKTGLALCCAEPRLCLGQAVSHWPRIPSIV